MENPVAIKLRQTSQSQAFEVSILAQTAQSLKGRSGANAPAVVVVEAAAILPDLGTGVIDADSVLAVTDGDWSRAILVLAPVSQPKQQAAAAAPTEGDVEFIRQVQDKAPQLAELARQTIGAIRAAGVDGALVEGTGGRWVNRPVNVFTLRAQPRAGNLQFTLYGEPSAYSAGDFLLPDQNSYSRGWVKTIGDADKLATLAKQAEARRKR